MHSDGISLQSKPRGMLLQAQATAPPTAVGSEPRLAIHAGGPLGAGVGFGVGAGVGTVGTGVDGAGGGVGVEGAGVGDGPQHARKTPEDAGQQSPGSAAQPGWALQEALLGAGGFAVGAGGDGVGGGVGLGCGHRQSSHRLSQDFCPHW